MRDPYSVLGLSRSASADDIKKAYRRLAKELHPDLNPGRADIEQRFKDVSVAYDLLSDPVRRSQYDRGEIEADGSARRPQYAHGAGADPGSFSFRYSTGRNGQQAGGDDLFDQIFGMFGGRSRGQWSSGDWRDENMRERPPSVSVTVTVPFETAIKGGTKRVRLPTGREVDVHIPAGTEDGTKLRLPEQGTVSTEGEAGDVIVVVKIMPHAVLRREGQDVHSTVPIDLHQAVLGDRITVQTIDGQVTMRIPEGSNSGARLRLRGKGVPKPNGAPGGDHYVTLQITLADPHDAELAAFLRARRKQKARVP
jgi:DnaJ-class molecular chaperone